MVPEPTVTRFYVLHFLMPLVLGLLILTHLHLLHFSGGSSLSYSSQKIFFFPFLIVKDMVARCACLMAFVVLACVFQIHWVTPRTIRMPTPWSPPAHIKLEWYFLFAYAILRCIPDKTTGVLALAASVVLPVCGIIRKRQGGLRSVGFFSYVFIWLTVFGGMPILLHYYFGSQVLSVLYFIYVLVFL